MTKKIQAATPALRVRNKGLRKVRVADLTDAEFNFRIHPESQAEALDGAIDELGFHGYPLCYELPDGSLGLYDGHLRKARLLERFGPDTEIEVAVTDFDEAEAKKAMLSTDPLAAMAEADAEKLDELLREVETGNEALAEMLTALAEENGIVPAESETSLKHLDTKPPPAMTWCLIGIPTVRFGEIAEDIERMALVDGIALETTVTN